jgi:thiol-disulfide isomerase/thioredoxin
MANELAGGESQSNKFPKEGLPGKPLVVEIYRPGCGACTGLDTHLDAFQKEFNEGKAQKLRINNSDENNQALLDEYKQRYSNSDKLPESFPNASPMLLFIDGNGNLTNVQQGFDVSQGDGVNPNDAKFAQNLGQIINEDANQILNEVGIIDSAKAKDGTTTITVNPGEAVSVDANGGWTKTKISDTAASEADDDPAPYKNLSLPGTKGKGKVIEFYADEQQATAVDESFNKISQATSGKDSPVEFFRLNAKDPKYAELVKAFELEKYPNVLFLDANQNLRSWFEGSPKNVEKQFARGVEQVGGKPLSIAEPKSELVQTAMTVPEQIKETQASITNEKPAGVTTEMPAIHSLSREEILKLTEEQRAGQFVRATNLLLSPGWDELAKNLIHCGKEARQHRYANQAEPRLLGTTIEPLPMALETTVGRAALRDSKEFRQERDKFKEMAEYYGFGVSKKPIAIRHDWQADADKQSAIDAEPENTFTNTVRSVDADSTFNMTIGKASMNIDFADGRQYRLQCSESGQRMIVENGSYWLCKDAPKENATLQDLENKFYTWNEYKPQGEIFQPTGVSRRFAANFDGASQALQFFNPDGTVREETKEGTLNYTREEWAKKIQQRQEESGKDKSK